MNALRPAWVMLLSAVIALAAGCGDHASSSPNPVEPQSAQDLRVLGQRFGLLACTPLPFDSVTQTIGPAGGALRFATHTLVVPAGALRRAVDITAVVPSDTVNRVQFSPAGLRFQRPASLTMSYANCGGLGALLPKQIVYTTDLLQILEYLGSVDNVFSRTVTARVYHFSDYVIAW